MEPISILTRGKLQRFRNSPGTRTPDLIHIIQMCLLRYGILLRLMTLRQANSAVKVCLIVVLCSLVATPNVLACGQCVTDHRLQDASAKSSQGCCVVKISCCSIEGEGSKAQGACGMTGRGSDFSCCAPANESTGDLKSLKGPTVLSVEEPLAETVTESASSKPSAPERTRYLAVSLHIPTTVLLR